MRHFSPLATGTTMLAVTLPVALLSVGVSKLYKIVGAKMLIVSGFSLLAIASLIQIFFVEGGSFFPILIACLLIGFGWVTVWGPSISCALSSIPHNLAGIASGMFTTMQELGAIVFLAIAGVVFRQEQNRHLAPYQDEINSTLKQFTPDQIDSLRSNPNAVEQVLGSSSDILPYLRDSFVESYHQVCWFLVVTSIVATILPLFLRKKPQ